MFDTLHSLDKPHKMDQIHDRSTGNEISRSSSNEVANTANETAQTAVLSPPPLQLKAENRKNKKVEPETEETTNQLQTVGVEEPSQPDGNDEKPNNTGLPSQLKCGIENLSGFSLDDVNVHYNSDKPAQLQAHAYAQGTDIHLASGQEKHLPHEAWHVVQQKQGRVQPTTQLKAFNINDDAQLEKEADVMGAKASGYSGNITQKSDAVQTQTTLNTSENPIQRFESDKEIGSFLEDVMGAVPDAPLIDLFKQAHGMNGTPTKGITDAQIAYQRDLELKAPKGKILDTHRSAGYEYEFATYIAKGEDVDLDSHNELGRSDQVSTIFKLPFILETDSDNELEIVTPPFLIANVENSVNKNAADNLYKSYKVAAVNAREKNKGKPISELRLDDYGFGEGWVFDDIASEIVVSEDRSKHTDTPDGVYSQLNISLTPKEMADFMDRQSVKYLKDDDAEVLAGSEIFSKAYFRILNLLEGDVEKNLEKGLNKVDPENELSDEAEDELWDSMESKSTTLNRLISRSLSNVLAIPGIVFNEKYRDMELLDSLHSGVKETFGIWVKDTIQNIVSKFVSADPGTATVMAYILGSRREEILKIIREELLYDLNGAFPKVQAEDLFDHKLASRLEEESAELRRKLPAVVLKEANTSMNLVLDILQGKLVTEFDYDSKFLSESFEGAHAGFGVRKETFVPIDSGTETDLHLAEIRGDESVTDYLKTD